MKAKEFFHHHLFDLLLVGAIVLSSGGVALYEVLKKKESALSAKVYCEKTLLEEVDLSALTEEVDKTYEGSKTAFKVGFKKGAVAILESGCPSQYCVHQGWVSESGRSIICAYNSVLVSLSGTAQDDLRV